MVDIDGERERGTMTTTCPFCQHHIQCLQCDNGICEACGADLWAEDAIPFTDTSAPNYDTLLEALSGKSEWFQISPQHYELIASGATATPEEMEFVERMLPIQREAITGTHRTDNETITLTEARDRWLENPEAQRIYEESEPAYQAERIIQRGGE